MRLAFYQIDELSIRHGHHVIIVKHCSGTALCLLMAYLTFEPSKQTLVKGEHGEEAAEGSVGLSRVSRVGVMIFPPSWHNYSLKVNCCEYGCTLVNQITRD